MNNVKLPYATLEYEEPIIKITVKPNTELGFPEMQELVQQAEKLSNYKNYFVLSTPGDNVHLTPEGKRFAFDSSHSPLQKGTAVVVRSNFVSIAANLYFGFNPPEFPYKVFTEEMQAVEWLMSLPLQGGLTSEPV